MTKSSTDHYENFPVASWLCPKRLRAPIAAIYGFARTADDIADEGSNTADERLGDLSAFERDLMAVASGETHSTRWPGVFAPLAAAIAAFSLPVSELRALLCAFKQDVAYSAQGRWYETDAQVLDYCARSANPVGRLLLHLYGVRSEVALRHSDEVCTALQLINFWQDLSQDLPRGRFYLSDECCTAHGVSRSTLVALESTSNTIHLIAEKHHQCWTMMQNGAQIVHHIPGRAGWELRLVVQGGLAILRKIEAHGFNTLTHRPKLRPLDAPAMLWRALLM